MLELRRKQDSVAITLRARQISVSAVTTTIITGLPDTARHRGRPPKEAPPPDISGAQLAFNSGAQAILPLKPLSGWTVGADHHHSLGRGHAHSQTLPIPIPSAI